MNGDFREDLKRACEVMQKGGVILYPTDTIWGIGCDATNPEAVKRVYDIKKRADSKAMLVLVDSTVKVNFYVSDVPAVAWDLIEFTTKPLTIIYDGARNLAENLLAEDGSVGIRVRLRNSPNNFVSGSVKLLCRLLPISAVSLHLPASVKSVKK